MFGEKRKSIGVFALVMINFAAIANVRTLPSVTPYGLSMLFFYFLATFCFLIPSALVSAELASSFPGDGGLYHWVTKAFGEKFGFLAVWLQNSNNFICFPTALSFVASTLAYGMVPQLAGSKVFTLAVILIMVWGGTLLTLNGVQITGIVSAIGGIVGTFFPIVLLIAIGLFWLASGKQSQMEFSVAALAPNLSSAGGVSLFLGVLLGFSGIEMSANHINDVKNPRENFPRAIFISSILILTVSVLGSMAIAIVVPSSEIMMNTGVMQLLGRFFKEVGLPWLIPFMAFLMVIGSIAWFCVWVSGPPRALHIASQCGHLPRCFTKLNRHGMPHNIMIAQAIVASALSILFIGAESVNAVFWMLTSTTAQLILMMYSIMFAAAIALRFKYPAAARCYEIPGGKVGVCAIGGIGFFISLLFYAIGFFPPTNIAIGNKLGYCLTIFAMNLAVGVLPCIPRRKPT